jgi:hypothetical protein
MRTASIIRAIIIIALIKLTTTLKQNFLKAGKYHLHNKLLAYFFKAFIS